MHEAVAAHTINMTVKNLGIVCSIIGANIRNSINGRKAKLLKLFQKVPITGIAARGCIVKYVCCHYSLNTGVKSLQSSTLNARFEIKLDDVAFL